MGRATQTVAFELTVFGIDLRKYLKKPIIFSEQGLGGCTEGRKVAPDLNFVRIHPFYGAWLTNGYSASVDPWKVWGQALDTCRVLVLHHCCADSDSVAVVESHLLVRLAVHGRYHAQVCADCLALLKQRNCQAQLSTSRNVYDMCALVQSHHITT
eukprot:GHUV01057113.1.p1 GENE.GHUV01057113.1~~GHUV01057113.1.p1  ORF type:complete len:155 (+),score=8.17 GHUV01057113.1:676-1140(+)